MNPYDFVPVSWENKPDRHAPIWHDRLIASGDQKLYTGSLDVEIKTETPLFIRDPETSTQNPRTPGTHIRNAHGDYIIPGSSLKGMLRTVAESLGNGCFTLFDGEYEYKNHRSTVDYRNRLPDEFRRCQQNTKLCITCRTFGMMQLSRERDRRGAGIDVFQGKVNIGDAVAENAVLYESPVFTAVLDGPKPRHSAFYLDEQQRHIAGRKYYFHQPKYARDYLHTEGRLIPTTRRNDAPRDPLRGGQGEIEYRNQHILPLDYGNVFTTRISFSQLEANEFALLMIAVALDSTMRHKIGYGKPLGLGSVKLTPTRLQLVDYARRYTDRVNRGITVYEGQELTDLIYNRLEALGTDVANAFYDYDSGDAISYLRYIWGWDPESKVAYAYPSRDWFSGHSRARIEDTANL